MSFDVFILTFKKIFKSWYCWMLLLISIVIFLLTTNGLIYTCIDGHKGTKMNKKIFRSFYLLLLFIILGIVISSLTEFAIDKQNLIFILSKHYKRINCLLEKIIALSSFLMIFIGLLDLGLFLMNVILKKEYDVQLWESSSELFSNCYAQIFLYVIYNTLFWSMASLYLNHRYCKLLLTLSQIGVVSLYIYLDITFMVNEKFKNKVEYTLFFKEIFLPNVSYCPISFITFILGLNYFYKTDLRI